MSANTDDGDRRANMSCPECNGRLEAAGDAGKWHTCRDCGRKMHQLALSELGDELRDLASEEGTVPRLARICLGEDDV